MHNLKTNRQDFRHNKILFSGFIESDYQDDFPNLISRNRFNRRRKRLGVEINDSVNIIHGNVGRRSSGINCSRPASSANSVSELFYDQSAFRSNICFPIKKILKRYAAIRFMRFKKTHYMLFQNPIPNFGTFSFLTLAAIYPPHQIHISQKRGVFVIFIYLHLLLCNSLSF